MTRETLDRVLQIGPRCYDKSRLTPTERRLILEAYREATGIRLQPSCGPCYATAYQHLLTLKYKPTMSTQQFQLKQGKKVALFGMADVYTQANMTDTVALRILKKAPKCIELFENPPANWREQASNFTEGPPRPAPGVNIPKEAPATLTAPAANPVAGVDVEAARRANLEAMDEDALKELCASLEMDRATYIRKKKNSLIALILEAQA